MFFGTNFGQQFNMYIYVYAYMVIYAYGYMYGCVWKYVSTSIHITNCIILKHPLLTKLFSF